MVAPYKQENTHENYKQLYIEKLADIIQEQKNNFFDMESMWLIQQLHLCYHLGYAISEYVLTYKPILDLVKTKKNHFDVVIMDQFYDESLTVIAHELNAPLLYFSTMVSSSMVNHLVGNPAPLPYVPNIFLESTGNLSFKNRLRSWFTTLADELYRRTIEFPYHNQLLHQTFPEALHVYDLLYKKDAFILVNSHISISDPVPLLPNMKEIGGFHVKAPALPKDLKQLLDGAQNGVVYFAMGSNLIVSMLPPEKKTAILNALGRLKQLVLWKWDEDTIEGKPENVILGKWFPQQAILAHNNTKAFISHGGLLSTIEAVSLGKPIIGIPIYGDQKMNINLAVNRGYALTVPYKQLTEENLFQALDQIINNSRCLFVSSPKPPLEEAIYWVEHVIKNKGARHFRSKAMDLKWYENEMLDVAGCIAILSFVILVAIVLLCKNLMRVLRFHTKNVSVRKKQA